MKLKLRYIYFSSILFLFSFSACAQSEWIDSVKIILRSQKPDTNQINTLLELSSAYQLNHPDSGFAYAQNALKLAENLHFEPGIFWAEVASSNSSLILGNYPLELEYAFKAFSLSEILNTPRARAVANAMMSGYYYCVGEYVSSLNYWHEVQRITEQYFPEEMWGIWQNLAWIYQGMNKPDSVMLYAQKAYKEIKTNQRLYKEDYVSKQQASVTFTVLGNGFAGKNEYDSALYYYNRGLPSPTNTYTDMITLEGYNGIATTYKATGRLDSAIFFAQKVLESKTAKSYPVSLLKAANLLSAVYELKNRSDSTLKYTRLAIGLKDSLFNRQKMLAIQNLTNKEQEKQQEVEAAKMELQNRNKVYSLIASFLIVFVVAGILLRTKRQKQLQNMRNNIADDLHDDIGSTLSSINIMSELAKANPGDTLALINSIGESAHLLQENMNDIVWAVNPGNDRLENVFRRMHQFASEILDGKNIELDFTSDESLSESKLTMGQRKNIYLFFKEAINNAAKYSNAKKVLVKIIRKNHHIEMSIRDNGKGFDAERNYNGNGMSTLRKRGTELNARVHIESHINEGTFIQLNFKIT